MLKIAVALSALATVAAGPTAASFKCSIAASGADVLAVVQSASSVPFVAEVHVALTLTPATPKSPDADPSYWAPVDLVTGLPYGANQPRHLSLQPHETIKGVLAPASLSWERSRSSVWPNRRLGEAVPNGRYILHLEIDGPVPGRKARSNGFAVVVDSGNLNPGSMSGPQNNELQRMRPAQALEPRR